MNSELRFRGFILPKPDHTSPSRTDRGGYLDDGSTRSPTECQASARRLKPAQEHSSVPGVNGGARRNGPNLEGGPTVSSRVGSPPYAKVRETAISRALGSEVTLAACADGETRFPAVRHGATVRVENPSVHSGVRPWNGRAREGFLRGRHVRSTCRRSVRPAIHVPSRGSPRSSSTGEPSDPPFGALHSELNALFTRVPSPLPTKLGKTRTTEGDASETEVPKDGASLRLAPTSVRREDL